MTRRPGSRTRVQVHVVAGDAVRRRADELATEEPLEIRLVASGAATVPGAASGAATHKTVAVTMRTPGHDFELAAGFLFTEGIVPSGAAIRRMTYCVDPGVDAAQQYNIVNVELARSALPDLPALERHFFTSSACGVCGKASLEAMRMRGSGPAAPGPAVPAHVLAMLPERLQAAQGIFQATGGLHAAALFDASGELIALREDVGRHNALDKLIGWAVLNGRAPLRDHLVMVSGRASFELLQKTLAAQAPIFCAVSAPSSLAVQVATEFGMTLIGFLRGGRFNVYAGVERIQTAVGASRV
ncbi:MAG: formate dehydrogenase accessory sulfurtransferase FdhD [Armatimonadota bacterium]|nr:formate dehydrogenase accessory sulfurtransferase FdhD [Armatimonadota bacterium]